MRRNKIIWSDDPERFLEEIASRLEGPYKELLEAVRHLNKKISEGDTTKTSHWLALESRLFGDPASLFEEKSGYGLGFSASLIDGPYVDIFMVAGLRNTDELSDGVWGNANWLTILESCWAVSIEEQESIDEFPGQNDTFYWCEVADPRQFARELRISILTHTVGSG